VKLIDLDSLDQKSSRAQIEPLKLMNPVSLAGLPVPPREWLVTDLIPKATVTLLGGDGGTGKSLLMQQLSVAIATGNHWLGRPVGEGRVLYLSAEDDEAELHRRLFDICREYATGFDQLGRLKIVPLAGEDALLATTNGATMLTTKLFKQLENLIADWQPAVVIFDTLADVFGGSENDRSHARQFIGMLRGLAIRHQMAVVVLSHPSLTGISSGSGLSGSTAWNNSVRSRLYLDRVKDEAGFEADTSLRELKTVKSNYGPTGNEISMQWQAGVFIPWTKPDPLDGVTLDDLFDVQKLIHGKEYRKDVRSANWVGNAIADVIGADLSEEKDLAKVKFALKSWLESGVLVSKQVLTETRNKAWIVEVGEWTRG
jgi:RecA-family ATPase